MIKIPFLVSLVIGLGMHLNVEERDIKPAPIGFDVDNPSVPKGKIESIEYFSGTVGVNRKAMIYTPPEYSPDKQYPVLYLLHGIGGDEGAWIKNGRANIILDNLYFTNKVTPMIVVMPNGRAMRNDRAEGNLFADDKIYAFENFENDLFDDLIPYIESHYSVQKNKDNRALAGLSMGGGQALNFGLTNPDVFSWIGAFSPAPNTESPETLVPEPQLLFGKHKLIWISCGEKDPLLNVTEQVHDYLELNHINHIIYIEAGSHDFDVWKSDLYHFSQLLFKN